VNNSRFFSFQYGVLELFLAGGSPCFHVALNLKIHLCLSSYLLRLAVALRSFFLLCFLGKQLKKKKANNCPTKKMLAVIDHKTSSCDSTIISVELVVTRLYL